MIENTLESILKFLKQRNQNHIDGHVCKEMTGDMMKIFCHECALKPLSITYPNICNTLHKIDAQQIITKELRKKKTA